MKFFNYGIAALCGLAVASLAAAAELAGSVQWHERITLGTPVSGVVSEVAVAAGDRVTRGQVLLRLDARAFNARIAQAGARLAVARDARDEAGRELERATEMYERALLADHELQMAKIELGRTEAEVESAAAALTLARLELEYSRIVAPFDAVVLERHAAPGQTVVSRLQSVPLLVLAASERMLVRATGTAEQLAGVQRDGQLQLRLLGVQDQQGQDLQGRVHRLGLEPVSAQDDPPRYLLEVSFESPADRVLRAGAPAVIVLP